MLLVLVPQNPPKLSFRLRLPLMLRLLVLMPQNPPPLIPAAAAAAAAAAP
jgi:hypothetical protein